MKDYNKTETYQIIKAGDFYVCNYSTGDYDGNKFIGFSQDHAVALRLNIDISEDRVDELFKHLEQSLKCNYQIIEVVISRIQITTENVIAEIENT